MRTKNAGRIYLDLWLRAYDDGMIIVNNEMAPAYSAGFVNERRAVRTWRERMEVLEKHGFISVRPGSNQRWHYVLLIDPAHIINKHQPCFKSLVTSKFFESWLNTYKEVRVEHGLKQAEVEVPEGG